MGYNKKEILKKNFYIYGTSILYNSIYLIITTGLIYNLDENNYKWNSQVENSLFDNLVEAITNKMIK